MIYQPGLHILSTIESKERILLEDSTLMKKFFDKKIEKYQLTKLGEVYYKFPKAGFTAVVCLTESHLSIHSWPEFNKATFDIFLSNYQKDNNEKCRLFFKDVLEYFAAPTYTYKEVIR